jgi:crotonobetainyl-CoA:carnitine CoA-transferase CaiB-like acyl-CoA transferase
MTRIFLEFGLEHEQLDMSRVAEDPEIAAIFGAGRSVLLFIAGKMSAYEFFIGAQARGLACGVVYSPEEVLNNPQLIARGFPRTVEHDDLNRRFTYPGPPFSGSAAPSDGQRRAPHLGEHNAKFLDIL